MKQEIGQIVIPTHESSLNLRKGFHIYSYAIVLNLDPFVIGREDQYWLNLSSNDFEWLCKADSIIIERCQKFYQESQKKKTEVDVTKAKKRFWAFIRENI